MKTVSLLATVVFFSTLSIRSFAAPTLRVQLTQKGDFALLGNTLGFDCESDSTPIVGDVGMCGGLLDDTAPDIFWRADEPTPDNAEANLNIDPADARSSAVLDLPPSVNVTRAFLYWAATENAADGGVTLQGPLGAPVDLVAEESFVSSVSGFNAYASVVDVTALVDAEGPGAYRVSGVALPDWRNIDNGVDFGAWWMVVLYEDPAGEPRNLALFDGLDGVADGISQDVVLDGFSVPDAGFSGALGVVALEGDEPATGDQLSFENVPLGNDENPTNNFFNGSRTSFGLPVHFAGDLPELTGEPGSMAGIDLDIVDVTSLLSPGQTAASIEASSSGDVYWLSTFVTSIATFSPDFVGTTKAASDLDGAPFLTGDVVEFEIVVRNGGNDDADGVVVTDTLAAGFTYLPSSLSVDGVARTDQPGDDLFDFDEPTATLVVRVGVGADATNGGVLAPGESATVRFRATIDDDAIGTLTNQARIDAEGVLGGQSGSWLSGSNGGPGAPTIVEVEPCEPGTCGAGGGGAGGGGAGGEGDAASSSGSSSGGAGGGSGGEGGDGGKGAGGDGAGGSGGEGGDGGRGGTSSAASTSSSTQVAATSSSGVTVVGAGGDGGDASPDPTLSGNGLTCRMGGRPSQPTHPMVTSLVVGLALALRRRLRVR